MASPTLSQAEEQAYNLLLAHLTDAQKETFWDQGWFEFLDGMGKKWRLYTAQSLFTRSPTGLYTFGRLINLDYGYSSMVHGSYLNDKELGCNVWETGDQNPYYVPDKYDTATMEECTTLLALMLYVSATGQQPPGCNSYQPKEYLYKVLPKGWGNKYRRPGGD